MLFESLLICRARTLIMICFGTILIMSNTYNKRGKDNNFQRGARGGRGNHPRRDQQIKSNFSTKKPFERKFKEENRKEISLYKKEAKELKEFNVKLGGDDTEKVVLPTYGDDDRDETLLTLVKEFNMMIKDGDLMKDEEIGLEDHRNGFTSLRRKNKLKAIKETFRKFRSCLKGEPRDKWIILTEDLPVIS